MNKKRSFYEGKKKTPDFGYPGFSSVLVEKVKSKVKISLSNRKEVN